MAYYYNQQFLEECIGKGIPNENIWKTDLRDGKGKTEVYSGESKINESIRSILSTRIGERLFLPEYGSRLWETIFEPNDLICRDLIVLYIKEALANWEKRIVVVNVFVGDIDDSNVVPVTISYRITNSDIITTYIYPFNMSENGEMDVYSLGSNSIDYKGVNYGRG